MKRIILIFTGIVMLFFGCSREETTENYVTRPDPAIMPLYQPLNYSENSINSSISIMYPVYGISDLDMAVNTDFMELVDKIHAEVYGDKTMENMYSLSGNYDTYEAFNGRLQTIKMNLFYTNPQSTREYIYVYHYDTLKQRIIDDVDVFAPGQEYPQDLSVQAKAALASKYPSLTKERIETLVSGENLSKYAFTDRGLLMFFPVFDDRSDLNEKTEVLIPYQNLSGAFEEGYPFS